MQQLKITPSITERTHTVDEYLRDISKLGMISLEEETELATRIQAGDEEAFKQLVEANLRFVVSVAKQYQGRGLELPDLINEGNLGLMKAARRFDPTRGFKFISYAVWWVRQQIIQAIYDQSRMVRMPLNKIGLINKMNRISSEFTQANEREPSDEELAELMDLDPDKMDAALKSDSRGLSLDFPLGDDASDTLMDILPNADSPQADQRLDNESLHDDIETVMTVLSERERQIVRLSFGLGCPAMSLEDIGNSLELTRERVRQLMIKAIRKLSSSTIKSVLVKYL